MAATSGGDLKLGEGVERAWRAYQLFYHADQDQLLRRLVQPLTSDLLRAGIIDRIFFVRYELGGPHIRLRWRTAGDAASIAAEAALADRVANFFARWPSLQPLPAEKIRSTNRVLLGIDPMARADDDQVYADNSWFAAPVRFEITRYGGLQHLGSSLDLFTLSSARVLRLLSAREEAGGGWVRPVYLRLALHLAWGMAGSGEDFLELVEYALRFMGEPFAACVEQGDYIFAKRRHELMEMVQHELKTLGGLDTPTLAATGPAADLAVVGCCLAGELADLGTSDRWYLLASHIHMTANRLGLKNSEEVYLSRLLWRAADALRQERPEAWRELWGKHSSFAMYARSRSLAGWVTASLADLIA